MYAAKNDRIARVSVPISIGLVMLFLLYGNVYLGAAARVMIWDQIASPDQAFPLLVTQLLTPALAALALTGIASAAMSTTDSLLLMSGSAIAHDLLRRSYDEPRGIQRDERTYLKISRWSIVLVGTSGIPVCNPGPGTDPAHRFFCDCNRWFGILLAAADRNDVERESARRQHWLVL